MLPPDSEFVAPVTIHTPVGVSPGRCLLVDPDVDITENYGVLVGRTLVDASELVCQRPPYKPGIRCGGVAFVFIYRQLGARVGGLGCPDYGDCLYN